MNNSLPSRKSHRKLPRPGTIVFYICAIAAIGMCVALVSFIIYVLSLRTQYRATALEINSAVLATKEGEAFLARGEERFPAESSDVEYYNRFLLDDKTVVFNKKGTAKTDQTICLTLHGGTLYFTGQDDGTAINVVWETGSGSTSYTVRSQTTMMQLNAYMSNFLRRARAKE